jgi:hypothetical protein
MKQGADQITRDDFDFWRRRVCDRSLCVGSFTAMASQLPLFFLRKRKLVERVAAGGVLDPKDVGIGRDDAVRWLVVYDIDDPLGFATRELYGNHDAIRQVQVDTGDTPVTAHVGYWRDPRTIEEAAKLIAARSRAAN